MGRIKDWVKRKEDTMKPRSKEELRSKDVAHILDISPDDVIDIARRGHLKGRKDGRFWRFTLKDVRQYQKQFGD